MSRAYIHIYVYITYFHVFVFQLCMHAMCVQGVRWKMSNVDRKSERDNIDVFVILNILNFVVYHRLAISRGKPPWIRFVR